MDAHKTSRVEDCRLIDIERHIHPNGSLSVIGNDGFLPFDVRRVFYLYDIPGDADRGGHSHFEEQQLIVAAGGMFEITVTDGVRERHFVLKRPYQGLYVPAGIWNRLYGFSSGSIALVLSSSTFDGSDYVRDYDRFMALTAVKRVSESETAHD